MGDTLKSFWDEKRESQDLLEKLDKSKGGIPATAEVKNKDKLIVLDPEAGWTREIIDEILTSLATLRLGFIRTLTIVRKQ